MSTSGLLLAPDTPDLASPEREFLRPHDFLLPYIMEWEGPTDAQVVAAMAQDRPVAKKRRTRRGDPRLSDFHITAGPSDVALGPPPTVDMEHCAVCGVTVNAPKKKPGKKSGTATEPPKAAKKTPRAPWCQTCQTARSRLNARRQLTLAVRPNRDHLPCALCGCTASAVLPVDQIFADHDKASAFGDPAGWVRRDSAWTCLPCASVYAVTGVRSGKLWAFAFAQAPDGSLTVALHQEVPWWDAPASPSLVVYHRGQTGGIVQRLARTEVSVDPDTVIINVIDSTNRYPTRLTFPRASPDMQTAIRHMAATLTTLIPPAKKNDGKPEKYPPEFWTLLTQCVTELLPPTAHASPLWQETRHQLWLEAQRGVATPKEVL